MQYSKCTQREKRGLDGGWERERRLVHLVKQEQQQVKIHRSFFSFFFFSVAQEEAKRGSITTSEQHTVGAYLLLVLLLDKRERRREDVRLRDADLPGMWMSNWGNREAISSESRSGLKR